MHTYWNTLYCTHSLSYTVLYIHTTNTVLFIFIEIHCTVHTHCHTLYCTYILPSTVLCINTVIHCTVHTYYQTLYCTYLLPYTVQYTLTAIHCTPHTYYQALLNTHSLPYTVLHIHTTIHCTVYTYSHTMYITYLLPYTALYILTAIHCTAIPTTVDGMQSGRMLERGTIDAVFILRRKQQEHHAKWKKMYVFCGPRESFLQSDKESVGIGNEEDIPEVLARSVCSLYDGAKTRVSVDSELLEELEVKVGVHQGSVLSPFLFPVVVDVVTEFDKRCAKRVIVYWWPSLDVSHKQGTPE